MVSTFIPRQVYSMEKVLNQNENRSFSSDLNNIIIKIMDKKPSSFARSNLSRSSGYFNYIYNVAMANKKNIESKEKIGDLESQMNNFEEESKKTTALLFEQENDYIALKSEYEKMKSMQVKELENQISSLENK